MNSINVADGTHTDLDSHADQCVVSDTCALLTQDYQVPVSVTSYDPTQKDGKTYQTVTGVVAYDHPKTGETYYLHIHQAINVPGVQTILLSPNQIREIGNRVNDEPKHLVPEPTPYHHALTIKDQLPDDEELIIPLRLRGVTPYFHTRKPTQEEYDTSNEDYHLNLTSDTLTWEPEGNDLNRLEESMLNTNDELMDYEPRKTNRSVQPISIIPNMQFGADIDPVAYVAKIATITRKHKTTAVKRRMLAKRWRIGLDIAERTINATTQRIVRKLTGEDMNRRFSTNDRQLRYRRLAQTIFTDTLKAKIKSWFRKNKYAQVFATEFGFVRAFPMEQKSEAHNGFKVLAQTVGLPPIIVCDGAKEQTMGEFRKFARKCDVRVKQIEPYSPWANACEGQIRELKRGSARKQLSAGSPAKLWDHSLELEALIRSHTALNHPLLQGQVPESLVTGQPADISVLSEFAWYDWVRYFDTKAKYPNEKQVYGRWLGPITDVGNAMTCKVLKRNGQIFYTSSYRALTEQELNDPREIAIRKAFDKDIAKQLGGPITPEDIDEIDPNATTPQYETVDESYTAFDIDNATPEYQDTYLGAEVTLPLQGTMQTGKVTRRTRDTDGNLIGTESEHSILDTRQYDVKFHDGTIKPFTANVLAEHMIAQCDPMGNQYQLLEDIVGHKTDGTELKEDDMYITHGSNRHFKKTTKGWSLCVQWKDGSTSWERLADLKESYPIEVAEYAVAHEIDTRPAFIWWVKHFLNQRKRIVAAVNKRYHKITHKFGIEIPTTVKRAYEIDDENGNTLWRDAIEAEMKEVRIAFRVVNGPDDIAKNSQFMACHMIFTVKMEANFRRKARLVAGGHMVDSLNVPTYASVVSRETVRIALTMAALNDLEVKASDIKNAFLCAPVEEVIHTQLGPEFGPDEGKLAVIVRALYGLKSAGSSFNRHLADCMWNMGYKACKADPDLWMKKCVRPDDGFEYYAYILFYVDDCLAIHHDAESILKELDTYFAMKPGSIGDPDIYLGAKLRKVKLENGVKAWGFSPSKYVQEAVSNVEQYIHKNMGGRKLPTRWKGPWPSDYTPELDDSELLGPEEANYYQSLIGILHWMVELGRIDIITETSKLASHMALPREGHLEVALNMFTYLKQKHNSRMVFDPTYPEINQEEFQTYKWTRQYGDIMEELPDKMPTPLGKPVDIRMYVDADHAGDKVTRRSRTGYFIFLNSAPINWLSKKQSRIETSVFGAEFIAMKQGVETLRGLRYKLRMMGIPIAGPSYIFGDNKSVITNSSKPESVLNKKANHICYTAVREAVAMGECLIAHIGTHDNLADLATKIIPYGIKRCRLVDMILYDIESVSTVDD